MKLFFRLFGCFFVFLFVSCTNESEEPMTLTLNKEQLNLQVGKSETLVATLSNGSTSSQIYWTSDNSDVAYVFNGTVTGKSTGRTWVNATTGKVSARCEVIVSKATTDSILIIKSLSLYVGDTLTLSATVIPSYVENTSISWTSSNTNIVEINRNGFVRAKQQGTATITASNGGKSANCIVTVSPTPGYVKLNKSRIAMLPNGEETISVEVSSNLKDKELFWRIQPENIIKLENDGIVKAISEGSAMIIATVEDKSDTCYVHVLSQGSSYKGHKYVDLGLNVLWATSNVGASSTIEYGNYYSWGSIEKYNNKNQTFMNSRYDLLDAAFYYEDVAKQIWGWEWRTPTKDEYDNLVSNCDFYVEEINGVKGYVIVSKRNGKSIFLPWAGSYITPEWTAGIMDRDGWTIARYRDFKYIEETFSYWTSTNYYNPNIHIYAFAFDGYSYRCNCYCIRPVCDK